MQSKANWSLRRRTLQVTGVAVLAAWLAGGAAIFVAADNEAERMCHENLTNLAHTVLTFAEHELREVQADGSMADGPAVHHETVATLGGRYAYQIWSRDGELLLRSVLAPASERILPRGTDGLQHSRIDGEERDAIALSSPAKDMEILVVDVGGEKAALSRTFTTYASLAFLLSFVPLMLGTWWVTNKGFGAISGASRQLQRRGARDLTPIEVANPPRELEPFLEAMNGLLDQMRQAMAREREFTSLAAHELLTPLAAMRIQAQVLARTEAADERSARAAALMHSVDRCALLSTQLLNLARADAMVGSLAEVAPVRIDEACAEVLADFVADASRRRIDVACDLAAEQVLADRVGLQTLLRNLVGNAMRHTPDEGSIRIAASDESGRIVLRVEDSGEGIPEPERERVFQRFYRGRQSAGVGAGLGLAIVSSIVEAHRAVIALGRSPLGGLQVEVQFPRAAPA